MMVLSLNAILLTLLVIYQPSKCIAERSFPHPVGFWMFDRIHEGKDLSGNGNDAVLYNTEWTSGPFGTPNRAMKFTGADDQSSRAEIPNVNRALSVTDSFTWLTYIKDFDNAKSGPIFSLGNQGSWGHIFWKCCNGGSAFHPRFDVRHNGGSAWSQSTANFFPADVWMKVAVTYDQPAGVIRIYQYGEERVDLRASYSGLLDDQWDQVYLGAVANDERELDAGVFCTMYFGDALSREELSAAFSLCRPQEMQSLYPWPAAIAHWPMNKYFGVNNALEGLSLDGEASYYSRETGPDGEPEGAHFFRNSEESLASITNTDNKLNVNSFTFSAWIKPGTDPGPIFRFWANSNGENNAPHIWQYPSESQLYYAHYDDASLEGTYSTAVGTLNIHEWNYIAVVYDYGQGYSYMYTNDVMRASYNHGNHATKNGPTVSMVDWHTAPEWARDRQLSCVQWFKDPLSSYALSKIKDECQLAKKNYKPSAIWIFPFNKANGLREQGKLKKAATTSGTPSYAEGARKRPNEALSLAAGQSVTLPSNPTGTLTSFTVAVHVLLSSDTEISLLGDNITVSQPNIAITLGESTFDYADVTSGLDGEVVWLGVVYDGDLGMLTIYVDGNPAIVTYVGAWVVRLPDSLVITNTAGSSSIQCYQFYASALNLRQFVPTRDVCIRYGSPSSLPYPRGFWPLNGRYMFKDLTGRSGDMQPLHNSGITFTSTGPHGEANSAAFFDLDNNNATALLPANRVLDVKFSLTVSAWIKIDSNYRDDRKFSLFSWRPSRASDYTSRDDEGQPGFSIHLKQVDGIPKLRVRPESTNAYINTPESTGHLYFDEMSIVKDEWFHLALVHDWHGKQTSVYYNGELSEIQRGNRFIAKTFYMVMIGGAVNFDNEEVYDGPDSWEAGHLTSCVQLYDVPLSKEQVKRTMKICKTETLSAMYSKNPLVSAGRSRTSPDSTVDVRSKVDCVIACRNDPNCKSIGYGDEECDLSTARREDLADADFSSTGDLYMEKDEKPWKLFV